ncbi:DUF6193 family natural product biosynthesis protein [Streptomyces sp. NBC_00038]|uniref:DUF6193 family natural product biosynthesis protein n=1 Tax=Streptomyces sp. NBC_00038 TaxID=2903615 RepID=UPI002254B197|nr:DUF6193 family natural product biosynthesis protein [Streptomyces sp. NBC_00038]MCX5558610.1 DUF6193 family natural product biosynthesis protein [Streptomyces sp. NBC_00038]
MNSEFYPDLIEAGGLAAALERSAADLGVPLILVPGRNEIPDSVGIATTAPGRLPLLVFPDADARGFHVIGRAREVDIVTGQVPELRDVVEAGALWAAGTPVPRMREALPSLLYDAIAEAHERGPAAAVEAQWDRLKELAADTPSFPEFGLLLEAAHAEPRLRQLFPFTSHWTVAFSSCTGRRYRTEVAISPQYGGGRYIVLRHTNTGLLGETPTVEEAVALALANLPDSVGPAVAGHPDGSD